MNKINIDYTAGVKILETSISQIKDTLKSEGISIRP